MVTELHGIGRAHSPLWAFIPRASSRYGKELPQMRASSWAPGLSWPGAHQDSLECERFSPWETIRKILFFVSLVSRKNRLPNKKSPVTTTWYKRVKTYSNYLGIFFNVCGEKRCEFLAELPDSRDRRLSWMLLCAVGFNCFPNSSVLFMFEEWVRVSIKMFRQEFPKQLCETKRGSQFTSLAFYYN